MGLFEPSSRIIGIIMSALLLGIVIDLVRRRKLSEQYSMVWILSSASVLLLDAFDGILVAIGRLIGATNLSSTLFLMGLIFIVCILLDLTIRLSILSVKLRKVSQELGLLKESVGRGSGVSGGDGGG